MVFFSLIKGVLHDCTLQFWRWEMLGCHFWVAKQKRREVRNVHLGQHSNVHYAKVRMVQTPFPYGHLGGSFVGYVESRCPRKGWAWCDRCKRKHSMETNMSMERLGRIWKDVFKSDWTWSWGRRRRMSDALPLRLLESSLNNHKTSRGIWRDPCWMLKFPDNFPLQCWSRPDDLCSSLLNCLGASCTRQNTVWFIFLDVSWLGGKKHKGLGSSGTILPRGYEYLGNSFRLVITPLTDMSVALVPVRVRIDWMDKLNLVGISHTWSDR